MLIKELLKRFRAIPADATDHADLVLAPMGSRGDPGPGKPRTAAWLVARGVTSSVFARVMQIATDDTEALDLEEPSIHLQIAAHEAEIAKVKFELVQISPLHFKFQIQECGLMLYICVFSILDEIAYQLTESIKSMDETIAMDFVDE